MVNKLNTMNEIYQYKSVFVNEATVKDVDTVSGVVKGYFSIFGNIDSDEDVVMPGAFKKTVSENYRRIKHLYQHDPWRPLAGTNKDLLVVKEDTTGLYFESTISKTSWGKDTIQLYMDGVVDEQSIGFQTLKSNDKGDYRELTELKLWEGSTVTWGANQMARSSMKSLVTVDQLTKKMDAVIKAIRNGKYENEDIFDQLEVYFKQLQQLFIDLTTKPGETTSTLPENKENDLLDVFDAFNNNLNTAKNGNERIGTAA